MNIEPAMLWSVRASLALLTAGFVAGSFGRRRTAARCWGGGAALMWLHVALAMGGRHGWSHAAAVRETARQTGDLTGLAWGGGVWVNYLFAAVWTGDAVRRVRGGGPGRIETAVGAFLGFVAVNGAVVFADGPARWCGAAACGAVPAAWAAGRRQRSAGAA